MKRFVLPLIAILFIIQALGCSGQGRHHKTALPEPESYNAHFGDMDANGDELVNWEEFKSFFEHTEPEVFKALDLNQDGGVDHDEWHAFKDAHGMRDHD